MDPPACNNWVRMFQGSICKQLQERLRAYKVRVTDAGSEFTAPL